MLYMIGYDLRRPQYYSALGRGVRSVAKKIKPTNGHRHASACNVRYGPWLVSSDQTEKEILDVLVDELRKEDFKQMGREPAREKLGRFNDKQGLGRFNDKLIVVPIGDNPSYRVRSPQPEIQGWFRENRVKRLPGTSGDRALAIGYTLTGADSEYYDDLRAAIWKSFSPDCTNPVYALWFVRTGKTAADVYRELGSVARKGRLACRKRLTAKHAELLPPKTTLAGLRDKAKRLVKREAKLEGDKLSALRRELRALRGKIHRIERIERDLSNLDYALLVIEVEQGPALTGLDRVRRDPFWLWQHGIEAEMMQLEEADPRAM